MRCLPNWPMPSPSHAVRSDFEATGDEPIEEYLRVDEINLQF